MPTTTLTLGAVTLLTPPTSPGPVVVGDPPQWSDGSDASYAYIWGGNAPLAETQAAPVAGDLTAWTATLRLATTPGFGPNPVFLVVQFFHPDSEALLFSEDVVLPNDGAVHEITVAGEPDDLPDPGYNPPGWLALGPYVHVGNQSFGSRVYVYEASLTVTTTDDEKLVTRLFPRKDAHGPMGSAPRLIGNIPPERIVGGHM